MKKSFLILFCLAVVQNVVAMDKEIFFSKTDIFFNKYTTEGKVKYKIIKENDELLDELTDYIATAELSPFSPDEQKAFHINAYNLLVIHSITEHYPVTSPMKISGFFDQIKHNVGGQRLTLNDIENKKLRKATNDPRIHFVLVCAAKGCPKIKNGAYLPDKLDQQLDHQTRKALNDDYFIRVQDENHKVLISQIFKWYESDFVNDKNDLISYINRYRNKKIDPDYEINYYEYDWQLNDYH